MDNPIRFPANWSLKDRRRFLYKIRKEPDGCIIWTGAKSGGYAYFRIEGKTQRLARYLYKTLVEPLEPGEVPDHTCRNRACVNVEHLERVTNKVNILRGIGPSAENALKTKCPKGHPYSGKNIDGKRICSICQNIASAKWRSKQ